MSSRGRFIVRRLLLTIPVLLAMSVFVFLIIRLVPGDPVRTMLGFRATDENVAEIRGSWASTSRCISQYLHVARRHASAATSARTSSARRRSASSWRSGCR